jgi:hypothetical protein
MLVSCCWATPLVAQQALTGIELEAEFAQARQRKTWDRHHPHRRGLILGHPDRQLRQRAVRLADDQSDFVTVAVAPRDHDRFAAPGMEPVADDSLIRSIMSVLKLPRRRREPS